MTTDIQEIDGKWCGNCQIDWEKERENHFDDTNWKDLYRVIILQKYPAQFKNLGNREYLVIFMDFHETKSSYHRFMFDYYTERVKYENNNVLDNQKLKEYVFANTEYMNQIDHECYQLYK